MKIFHSMFFSALILSSIQTYTKEENAANGIMSNSHACIVTFANLRAAQNMALDTNHLLANYIQQCSQNHFVQTEASPAEMQPVTDNSDTDVESLFRTGL